MTRRYLLGLAAALLLGAGVAAGWALRGAPPLSARAYAQNRLVAVQVHLDEAPADYVFLAGDSQAELQAPAQRPCGLELVNGGVSGASAAVYADLLDALRFPRRPRAATLTIGSNNLLRKSRPRDPAVAEAFEAAASRIIRRLQAETDRVVVTAVPPVGRALADRLDAEAVEDYSRRLRALCGRLGCTFADPFAALRDGAGGFAVTGALRDGLHLSAYRPALAALGPSLCNATTP